jgi:antirestriction protein ArdC
VLPLRHNGIPYRGVNVLSLWMQGLAKGYSAPRWMTFKQAIDLGGGVRKGEKGSLTVYDSTIFRAGIDAPTGEESPEQIHFLKGYTVFNVEQIAGLPEQYYDRPALRFEPLPRIAHADAFFAATRAEIVHGGCKACYIEGRDYILMPCIDAFESAEAYCSTLAHEGTHWTKHPSRLAREFGRKRWGDEGYAMEELVAELGSAFLCADLELAAEPREDHASYIDNWLNVLKRDSRAIFTAASHAQRAVDLLHELQTGLADITTIEVAA